MSKRTQVEMVVRALVASGLPLRATWTRGERVHLTCGALEASLWADEALVFLRGVRAGWEAQPRHTHAFGVCGI